MSRRSALLALAGALLGAGLVLGGIFQLPTRLTDREGAARPPAAVAEVAASPADGPVRATAPAVTPPGPTPRSTPTATPSPEPEREPTPEPAVNAALQGRLGTLVADPALAGASVAVHVTDAAGDEVFDHHAGDPLLPASTVKLVTAAAALAELGPDFRFTTTVHATAVPGTGGVLEGDIVLVGGGDPVLGSPTFGARVAPQRPRTPLEVLADRVAATGVRRVTGRVLGDPTVLPHEPEAPGWLERYLARGDATRASGLTLDAGRRLFVSGGQLQSAPATDPAAEAAAALTVLLRERDIAVDGTPGVTHDPPPAAHVLAAVESPPLQDLLVYMVQRSDNHLADAVFRALGAASGDGSWAGSAAATRAALAPLDLDWHGTFLADGSGLSRDDRLTARLLTTLDARMQASNRSEQWRELMAVSGRSGTLRRRLLGTVAEGRLAGKTGSLRDTRSLSGTVVGPDGNRYHFAVIANGLRGESVALARELQDALALALAEDLYGCERVIVEPGQTAGATPAPEDTAAEPVTELRCAA